MRIADEVVVPHPRDRVWDAVLDPRVLVRAIPGCERLEALDAGDGERAYAMTVTAGVASVRGTYDGRCTLGDLVDRESLVMRLSGAGAPGTVEATVRVSLADAPDGGTTVAYEADATVGGVVGGVGQRMLSSVGRRTAREFFGNLDGAMTGAGRLPATAGSTGTTATGTAAGGPPSTAGEVFSAPAPARAAPSSQRDFLAGVGVGAGLVALGVVLGAVLGRRR